MTVYLVNHHWFEGDGRPQELVTGGTEVFSSKEAAEAYIERVYNTLLYDKLEDEDVIGLCLRKGIATECDRRVSNVYDRFLEQWEIWERSVLESADELKEIEL